MFSLFKPKEKEVSLTDNIPVDNLKNYVVQGYEKEKELMNQLEQKERYIKKLRQQTEEFDALKVVLAKKETDIDQLERKLKAVDELQNKNAVLQSTANTLRIRYEEAFEESVRAKDNIDSAISKGVNEFSDMIYNEFSQLVDAHKGNLSKQQAKECLDSLLYVKTKEVS